MCPSSGCLDETLNAVMSQFTVSGLKSMLLEKRVEVLSEALEMKDAQLGEVLAAAHLDPATLNQVSMLRWKPCITCA